MMSGWLTRLRRIEPLEAEVAQLRASVAERGAAQDLEADRARAASATAELGKRLVELRDYAVDQEGRLGAIERTLAVLGDRLTALEEQTARALAQGDEAATQARSALADRLAALEDRTARIGTETTAAADPVTADTLAKQALEFDRMRALLGSFERQMRLHEADMGRTAAMLIRKIEAFAPDAAAAS